MMVRIGQQYNLFELKHTLNLNPSSFPKKTKQDHTIDVGHLPSSFHSIKRLANMTFAEAGVHEIKLKPEIIQA